MSCFCKLYRLDRCSNGGGLMLYIREDIPSRLLTEYKPPENVECLSVEINIRKKKWLYVAHITLIKIQYLTTCTICTKVYKSI